MGFRVILFSLFNRFANESRAQPFLIYIYVERERERGRYRIDGDLFIGASSKYSQKLDRGRPMRSQWLCQHLGNV